ncbi:MAG: hypothetical protein MUF81_07000 [Verrucomicrobia bacterium]|jgi:hypothetical protein|nr:hypothetical protein [Verrucomicrobiota bacterium]
MNETKAVSTPTGRGWLRKLLWLAGILVVLLVAAYFAVSSGAFIKGVVVPKVGAALNADLTASDATFSAFSRLELRDVKLTPKGAEPLFTASVVRARYGLLSILGGIIAIEELAIESPTITIVENADGTSNLDPLLKTTKTKPGEKKTPSAKPQEPAVVDVKTVTLNNATIRRVKNLKGGGRESLELANMTVTASNIKNGAAGKLDLSALLAMDKTAPAPAKPAAMQAKLNGSFTFDLTKDLKPANVKGAAAFAIEKATGDFADFAALAAKLDCDATPTEVKQLTLRFTQANEALGELRVSGPFDAAKSEGRLNVAVLSLDRRVLNLFGAASGIEFGTTVLNSTNVIDLSKGGSLITASGQLDAASVRITRQGQTTPTLDLKCGYDVTVDRTAQSALLKTLNITGLQASRLLLYGTLSSPMTIVFGNTSSAVGDAALNLTVTDLNLADWRAFAADLAPAGLANLKAKLLSQQAGKQLTFDLEGSVRGLGAKLGEQKISNADVKLVARGSAAELKQFKLDEYRVELAQPDQPALTISGSGTFDRATQDADLQVVMQAALARLLAMFPQPDANLTGGTVELKGRVTSKQQTQSVVGQLTLANLNGQYATYRFADFGGTVDLDVAMNAKQLDIRKATGELRSAGNAGGKFEVTGNLDTARKAGQLALKLTNFNQNGLRPFLESALGDKKLVSVSLNSTATANFAANGDAAVKADLQLANLVVSDPTSSSPATPLEAKAQVDAGIAKSVAQIRQCLLTLTPTQRAKNELRLTGTVDFSQTNAITGSLKLAADTLDVTRYYDLFGDQPKPATATSEAPAAVSDNREPDAVKLPFRNFTFEANVGRLYLREVDAANFQLVAKLDGSHVVIKPAQLALNGAPISATADLDLSVPGFKYDLAFSADKVPLEPLANSFSPTYRGQAKGVVIANASLKGAGVTGVNLKRTLGGEVNLNLTNANIQIVGPKVKSVLTPIALVLGAPELLNSPLNYLNARLRAGNGQIEVQRFIAHSDAFLAESQGVIPIADVLKDSRLNEPIDVSLPRALANKLRFSNVPTNVPYMKLPTFVHLGGTLGEPKAKTDKAVILGLTAAGLGGALGGKTGGILGDVGGLLGGKPQSSAPATNPPPGAGIAAPSTNVQPQNSVNDLINLFQKPKKKK